MHDALVAFTQSLPVWLQWAGVMLAAAVPFVESHFGTLIGVIAGIPLPVALVAAIVGNTLSMLAFVFVASAARRRVVARRGRGEEAPAPSPRRQRIRRLFERFGVPGVSLTGPAILPNQITSTMLVSFGADRTRVILWQVVSIVAWAVVFAVLAQLGLAVLR